MTETPPNEMSLSVRAEDGDVVHIRFTGFEKGSTILEALLQLSSPQGFQQIADEFAKAGDASIIEFAQKLERMHQQFQQQGAVAPASAPPSQAALDKMLGIPTGTDGFTETPIEPVSDLPPGLGSFLDLSNLPSAPPQGPTGTLSAAVEVREGTFE